MWSLLVAVCYIVSPYLGNPSLSIRQTFRTVLDLDIAWVCDPSKFVIILNKNIG